MNTGYSALFVLLNELCSADYISRRAARPFTILEAQVAWTLGKHIDALPSRQYLLGSTEIVQVLSNAPC
jgi:hypothetical protein